MSTREVVLAALRRGEGCPVSGQLIAQEAGVSRVAVAKQIAALQEAGYVIEAVAREGYVLRSTPALAVPWEVAPLVRSSLWTGFSGGLETGSTNDDAKQLARDGAEQGAVVVAASQSVGRGRLGREWESPEGGAYFSAVLRPGVEVARLSSLALVVALGVARGLSTLGVDARLKWPNDVLVAEGKIAGILLESAIEGDRIEWVVAGVGINVIPPKDFLPQASYLAGVGSYSPAAVAAAALDGIAFEYERWLSVGFGALQPEYASRDALTGQEVIIKGADGTLHAAGVAQGVDELGRLVVLQPDGCVKRVYAGEVTLRG